MPGTCYSEADSQGAEAVEPQFSQGYLAHVAARAVILIQADDPAIGLVAFVPVGMQDVSSCLIDDHVVPGAGHQGAGARPFPVRRFTRCLLFRPGVIASFAADAIPQPNDPNPPLLEVCSHLATASRGT